MADQISSPYPILAWVFGDAGILCASAGPEAIKELNPVDKAWTRLAPLKAHDSLKNAQCGYHSVENSW